MQDYGAGMFGATIALGLNRSEEKCAPLRLFTLHFFRLGRRRNMESIHGMPPGSFHGTIQDMMRTVHPEDRDMVSARIKRSIDTSEPYEVEYRTIGPGGQVGWIGAKGRVVYDLRTRRPLRMIGVAMNITEHKKNDEELSRLAAIVDASSEAIMSFAPDGTVLTWNGGAERIYGYSAQEMIGRNISVLTPPDRSQETIRKLASLRRGGEYP
jgi:PAS domain-containing protein